MSINIRDVIVQIDWAQLSVQKRWLEAQDSVEAEGLIHLLDAIQDAAVDEGLADENEVFFS